MRPGGGTTRTYGWQYGMGRDYTDATQTVRKGERQVASGAGQTIDFKVSLAPDPVQREAMPNMTPRMTISDLFASGELTRVAALTKSVATQK